MKRLLLILMVIISSVAYATVSNQSVSVTYSCSGSVGPYAFTFPISDPTSLAVIKDGTTLSSALYSVVAVNNNYANGGSVTLLSACNSPSTLVLKRITPVTQTTVYTDNMPIPMKTFERSLDKLTEIAIEQGTNLGYVGNWSCPAGQVLTGFSAYSPACGAIATAPTWSSTNTGVFTNTQMNEYVESIIDGLSPLAEFQAGQGANYATEAMTIGLAVPNTSTVYQSEAVGAYTTSASTTTNAVGGYFSARALATGAKLWPLNTIAMDNGFAASALLGYENDVNISNVNTVGSAMLINGAWTVQPISYSAIHLAKPGSYKWSYGIITDAGSFVNGAAIYLAPADTGNSSSSQSIYFASTNSSGVAKQAVIYSDLNGALNLDTGGTSQPVVVTETPGITAAKFNSSTSGAPSTGTINLAKTDAIAFEAYGGGTNLIGIDSSNRFTVANIISSGTIEADTGLKVGASGSTIADSRNLTQLRAQLSTTAATTDNVAITGATAASVCSLTATNASAATNIATTYISNKTTNQITVTHTATGSMTYDILCTVN